MFSDIDVIGVIPENVRSNLINLYSLAKAEFAYFKDASQSEFIKQHLGWANKLRGHKAQQEYIVNFIKRELIKAGFAQTHRVRSCLLPSPHWWLPDAVLVGNLVPFPAEGAKEWPDLYDWNLPGRFTTSPLGATGWSRFTRMTKIVLVPWFSRANEQRGQVHILG